MTGFYHHWGEHQFEIRVHDQTAWNDVPGIYVFALATGPFAWTPLYIGKAVSFKDRLSNHERWAEAKRRGAIHIHAKIVQREINRDFIERQLIQQYQPTMNTLLKSEGALSSLMGVKMPAQQPTFAGGLPSLGLLDAVFDKVPQPVQQPTYLTGLLGLGMLDTAMQQGHAQADQSLIDYALSTLPRK